MLCSKNRAFWHNLECLNCPGICPNRATFCSWREQEIQQYCQCKKTSTCSTKQGRMRAGCPCKTAGRFCSDLCTCSRRKCKNIEVRFLEYSSSLLPSCSVLSVQTPHLSFTHMIFVFKGSVAVQGWNFVQAPANTEGQNSQLTEEEERDLENRRVKVILFN